jgi:hypothetical protein
MYIQKNTLPNPKLYVMSRNLTKTANNPPQSRNEKAGELRISPVANYVFMSDPVTPPVSNFRRRGELVRDTF